MIKNQKYKPFNFNFIKIIEILIFNIIRITSGVARGGGDWGARGGKPPSDGGAPGGRPPIRSTPFLRACEACPCVQQDYAFGFCKQEHCSRNTCLPEYSTSIKRHI